MKFFTNKKAIKFRQKVAFVLALIMFTESFYPTVTFALTSGPSAPEFSSFEPVATTTMVNEFSGDFTYNLPVMTVPGANGGGYPISLSYHSGASPEEEASWVGYGWTLNPGAINRSTRGFPDDSKAKVTYHNKVPTNWTATLGFALDNEIFSNGPSLGGNAAIRYNNYKGFGYIAGVSFALTEGKASIGLFNLPFIFIFYNFIYPSYLLAFTYYLFVIPTCGLIAYLSNRYLVDFKSKGIIQKMDISKIIEKRKALLEKIKNIIPVA